MTTVKNKCKVCESTNKVDETGLCWVCRIKAVDAAMDKLERKGEPKPFLFNP